jgi:hypothetical protein
VLLGIIGMSGLAFAVAVIALGKTLFKPPKALPPGAGPSDRVEGVRRMLKHLVRGSVAQLADGTAAVLHGRATGTPALRTPLSNQPCLGFHLSIRTLTFDATLLYDHAVCGDFVLADETGQVAVRGRGLDLAITKIEATRYDAPYPEWLLPLLPRYLPLGVEVREGRLMPGDEVLVCGVAALERDVDNYRDGEVILVELRATPTFPLVASTDPDLVMQGDRPIDPAELPR